MLSEYFCDILGHKKMDLCIVVFIFIFILFGKKKKKMPRGKWQMPTVATCTGIHMADYRQRGHEPRC
jgi:hypothetical protein